MCPPPHVVVLRHILPTLVALALVAGCQPEEAVFDDQDALFADADANADTARDGDADAPDTCEVDVSRLGNCTDCSVPCEAFHGTLTCSDMACVVTCDAGYEDCNRNPLDGCEADLASPQHCGVCSNDCGPGTVCADGSVCACAQDAGDCNSDRTDGCETPLTTTQDCGTCGNACGNAAICAAGSCQCEAGFADCDASAANGCEVDLTVHDSHCGACGNACGSNAGCVAAACRCDASFADCDTDTHNGCEVNLASDDDHCGACGLACGERASCEDGECVCDVGRGNCNNDLSDGCETDLTTSQQHCGGCGELCSNANATGAVCVAGQCNLVCNFGWGNCNEDAADGCEADHANDEVHCGGCAQPCAVGQTCTAGECL